MRDTVSRLDSDHLRDGVVGQLAGDAVAPFVLRHAKKQMGHPSIDVQQDQASDLLIGVVDGVAAKSP